MSTLVELEVHTSGEPPKPPKSVAIAEPLGPCVKCGADGTIQSPGGSIYCEQHGKCGGRRVVETALGIEVRVCGKSVEQFVKHQRLGIWVCTCMAGDDDGTER